MKKLLMLLFFFCVFFSCKKDNASTSSFQGNWIGTYTSVNENGIFEIAVDKDGKVTGTASSMVFPETFDVIGNVSANGDVAITFGSLNSGGIFSGNMKGTEASGVWENRMSIPSYFGTWTGKKQ